MSCHDAREWLSDLLDDALAPEARAQVDAHLAGCADCRRELDRLRATVSLLHAVERPQAPAGFVDRVLEAARPTPWHRRLLDWLSAVRLLRFPVEAAAVVLVASLAVYVFQRTPELRQAARLESPQGQAGDSVLSGETGTVTSDVGSDNAGRAHTEPSAQVESRSLRLPAPVPPAAPPAPPLAAPEAGLEQGFMKAPSKPEELVAGGGNAPRVSSDVILRQLAPAAPGASGVPQGAAPTPGTVLSQADPSGSTESRFRSLRKDHDVGGAAERPTSQSPPVALGPVPAPEPLERLAREQELQRAERSAPARIPAARQPGLSAMRLAPSVHVVGRLTVKDPSAANRELAELVSRVGGAETARRTGAGGDTVDLVIPRAAYPAFAEGLARIGSWQMETEPAELPDRVPITLRIAR